MIRTSRKTSRRVKSQGCGFKAIDRSVAISLSLGINFHVLMPICMRELNSSQMFSFVVPSFRSVPVQTMHWLSFLLDSFHFQTQRSPDPVTTHAYDLVIPVILKSGDSLYLSSQNLFPITYRLLSSLSSEMEKRENKEAGYRLLLLFPWNTKRDGRDSKTIFRHAPL